MKTQVVLFTFLAIYVVHAAKHALGAESNLPEHWSIERIIARASEHTPEIKALIKDIERAIRLLAQTGEMAILLVEQYYDFAESLADQYLLMERGEFIMRGRGETMPQDGVREALAV